MVRKILMILMVAGWVCLSAAPAAAQVIGSFSWQMQPFCNVLTLTVVQAGPVYQLIGTDNLCGVGVAPVGGSAVPGPGGATVAMGLTVSMPSGRSAQVTATISLATLSGTWSDADGRSGSFVFGAASGGPPRPEPTGSSTIVVSQLSPTVYEGTGSATTLARSDHVHDGRYYTMAQIDTRVPQTDSVTLAGGGFVARDDFPVFQGGTGCFRNNTPAAGLRHTIPVTAGTTLTGLTVRTSAALASQSFTITLIRQPPGTTGGETVIASTQTPAATGLTTTNIPLPVPEVVNPGEAAYVIFSSSSLSAYLCAVEVQFNRP